MKMGYRQGARGDLARYLQLNPEAQDSGPLRERLVELSSGQAKTN
jgi:regulator of sirC expression with transglutaminase-like and TPR domain